MHEYLDLAAETGYFDDPRILYDLTPAEIAITIAARPPATGSSTRWRMFGPGRLRPRSTTRSGRNGRTGCGTWKDIFPDTTPKQPPVAGGDETTMQRNSTDIRWDGNDTWR